MAFSSIVSDKALIKRASGKRGSVLKHGRGEGGGGIAEVLKWVNIGGCH